MNPIAIAIPVGIVGLWLFASKSSASPAAPAGTKPPAAAVKPPASAGGKTPAQRMAEVIATGDPQLIRIEAGRLRVEGHEAEAVELERVAGLIAAELAKGNAAPPVVQVKPPAAAATLPGVPASLQGATLKKLSPAPFDTRVETVQQRLIALGWTALAPADGKFGPATETAVKDFQGRNALPADGIVGALTLVKLYGSPKGPAAAKPPAAAAPAPKPPAAAPAPAKPPAAAAPAPAPASSSGVPASLQGATLKKLSPAPFDTRVQTVQQRLITLGYASLSPADGKYGPATESAVKDFQGRNGLPADGIVGALTLSKLYSSSAKGLPGKAAPAPAPAAAPAAAAPRTADGKAPTITAALKSSGLLKNGKATGFKAPASSGQAVKDWQQVLFDLGFLAAKPDGKFGDATEVGTKAFQTAANSAAAKSGKPKLSVDGIVGPATVARAAEARVTSSGPATFTGDFFGDDSRPFSVPAQPLPDSPLPGIMPPMATVAPSPQRALAARVYNMIELAPKGAEDRALVALFQVQEGLKPTGFYGPAVAYQLAKGYGIVPPKPLYWTESRTRQSKANYRDAMRVFGEKDPQRAEEWRRAGDV